MDARNPSNEHEEPDNLNEHLDAPGDPDGLVAAEKERLWRMGQTVSAPSSGYDDAPRSYWPMLTTILLVVVAIVGAYFLGFHKASAPAAKKVQAEQNKTERKLAPATTVTKHYDSKAYSLSIDYPDNWIVSDTAAKLSVTSPNFAMVGLSGSAVGHVVITIQNQQTDIADYPTGGATASAASDQLTYKAPSNIQRSQTYLTPVGYHSTNGIDALYLTGDSAYTAGQDVPLADIVKGDPLVGVRFVKCAKSYCTGGAVTPITLQADSWKNAEFHAQVTNLIQSLILKP